MAKKRITVAASKAKGRRLQQTIAKDFSDITGIPCGNDELIESREMGQSGVDIKLIGDSKRLINVAVEAKAHEKWAIHDFLNQARTNQGDFEDWVLICKVSRKKPVAFLSYDYFIKLSGKSSLTDHDTFILKAWRTLKWIDDNRSKSKNDEWVVAASKSTNDNWTIIIEYSYYIRLLANLVAKRQNTKVFKRK